MQSNLHLPNIKQSIHLGVGDDERSTKQDILVSIDIKYSKLPNGCISDNIKDTLDYTQIAERVAKACAEKEYKLIEHLAHAIYVELKGMMKTHSLCVIINKLSPPHALLGSGAIFSYGDHNT